MSEFTQGLIFWFVCGGIGGLVVFVVVELFVDRSYRR